MSEPSPDLGALARASWSLSVGLSAHILPQTGPAGSRIPYIEQVSKVMLELKVLESSELTEIVVYGSYLYKLRAKWMLQSMAEWHRQRQERGERLGDEVLWPGDAWVVLLPLL